MEDEKENLLKLLDHEKRLKEGVLNTVEKQADIENELNHLKKENHDLAQENDHLNNQNDFNKGMVSEIQGPKICPADPVVRSDQLISIVVSSNLYDLWEG